MSKPSMAPENHSHQKHGSYMSYIVGFVLSIVLTLVAYFAVVNDWFSGRGLLLFVTGLAIVQLLVQLLFFLHLSQERGPRWNLMTFLFAGLVVFIVVIGSLWIMYNLDYNMTHSSPEELNNMILQETESIQPDKATEHHHHQ